MISDIALKKHVFQLLPIAGPLECNAHTLVVDVARMLRGSDKDAVVITNNKIVEGIFTQRDYMQKVLGNEKVAFHQPISNFMISNPVTIQTKSTVQDALVLMRRGGFRHLIAVDPNNRLINVINQKEIIEYLVDEAQFGLSVPAAS